MVHNITLIWRTVQLLWWMDLFRSPHGARACRSLAKCPFESCTQSAKNRSARTDTGLYSAANALLPVLQALARSDMWGKAKFIVLDFAAQNSYPHGVSDNNKGEMKGWSHEKNNSTTWDMMFTVGAQLCRDVHAYVARRCVVVHRCWGWHNMHVHCTREVCDKSSVSPRIFSWMFTGLCLCWSFETTTMEFFSFADEACVASFFV